MAPTSSTTRPPSSSAATAPWSAACWSTAGRFDWDALGPLPRADRSPTRAFTAWSSAEESTVGAFLLRARREGLRDFGACMSPHTAWLILQGIETLPLRMERHVDNTRQRGAFLAATPMVARWAIPSCASHPSHALAQRLLPQGLRLGLQLRPQGLARAGRGLHRGTEDLLPPGQRRRLPRRWSSIRRGPRTSAWTTPRWRPRASRPGTIRLSIGLEDADDLIDDLKRALKAAEKAGQHEAHRAMAAQAYAYTGGKAFDPALPTVVFVHGALHDHSVWTLLARWFAHHGRSVLAVDLPGTCGARARRSRVEDLADWLLALLAAAGVQRVALVGHSMGSLIALEAAARAPRARVPTGADGDRLPDARFRRPFWTAAGKPVHGHRRVIAFSFARIRPQAVVSRPWHVAAWRNRSLMRRCRRRPTRTCSTTSSLRRATTMARRRWGRSPEAVTLHLVLADQMTPRKRAIAAGRGARGPGSIPSGRAIT